MSVTIIDCEQRTPEWFAARAGRVTGSVAEDMLAKLKSGGEAAARRDLRLTLAIERITGKPAESSGFVSAAMQHGIDTEPVARAAYETITGNLVRTTGFVVRDLVMAGCSLDGDINNFEGILEIKCPKSATHVSYLKSDTLPREYLAQVTHNMFVTGAEWCDFFSFDDRMPEGLQHVIRRVWRKDLDLEAYQFELFKFLNEVDNEVASLRYLQNTRN